MTLIGGDVRLIEAELIDPPLAAAVFDAIAALQDQFLGDLARKLRVLLHNKERHGSRPCCGQHATQRVWHKATRHRIRQSTRVIIHRAS